MSYSAIICKIKTRPHPNADRLLLGNCLGNQVVVGLDTPDDSLGIFFPTDGQLSHEYCLNNNLYNGSARAHLGLPEGPVGFFDHNRRVRAQRFRQERSDGLWMPLSSLEWAGFPDRLREGDQLTELAGAQICQKYYNPRTLKALQGTKSQSAKREVKCFPKHTDTPQFRFVAEVVPEDGVYYITEKLHGTSGRYGRVWEEKPQTFWQRLLRRPPSSGWEYLNGTRNVIVGRTAGEGFYGTNAFRDKAIEGLTLHKGEILFFELVGWVDENVMIMPSHDTTKLQDKSVLERYGKTVNYTYGCPAGTCHLYLYKILNVNVDGITIELSWSQLVKRAAELGLRTVPLISGPLTANQLKSKWSTDSFTEALRWEVENHALGSSVLDDRQIREGVVLRVESPTTGTYHIKQKQFIFGVMEGFWKEKDTGVDLEEVS